MRRKTRIRTIKRRKTRRRIQRKRRKRRLTRLITRRRRIKIRRMVYASREIGCGYNALNRLCYLLGLPCGPSKNAFQAHIKEIDKIVAQIAAQSMNNSADEV